MLKIDIVTLFPEMFEGFLHSSIIKRALQKEKIIINIHNLRDYSTAKNKQVDDYPYGGGPGMILMCEPVFNAVDDLKEQNTKVIMTSPSGQKFNQNKALSLSKEEHLIILCGHYEGFDERISTIVDEEISIGDYILTGGEIPAMAITDSITRLVEGVINAESLTSETFNNDLVDFPNYTKPKSFNGLDVPEVLLSGHHQNIEKFRLEEQIKKTINKKKACYTLEKEKKSSQIVLKDYNQKECYQISPKAQRNNTIEVNKIIVVSDELSAKIIKRKIELKIQKLLLEAEDSDGSITSHQRSLQEAEKLKNMIINTYVKYLGSEYRTLIMRKLQIIMNQLRINIFLSKENFNEIEERQGRGR